jgi:hypothetical protein
MAGGGGSDVDYKTSPEQKDLFNISKYGLLDMLFRGKTGQGLYNIPQSMYPTKDWWKNLSPEIKSGINAPVMDMAKQMGEQFGSQGQMGSSMTGPSGAFGNALGEAVGRTWGPQSAMTGWNMMQPSAQAELQNQQAPWNMMSAFLGQGSQLTPQPVVSQNSNPMASAASGALAGSAIMPGWGTALGAGMGYLGGK